jgi:hypothetical protein
MKIEDVDDVDDGMAWWVGGGRKIENFIRV